MERLRNTAINAVVAVMLFTGLTACESLLVKLDGGSNSGVDWKVGVRF